MNIKSFLVTALTNIKHDGQRIERGAELLVVHAAEHVASVAEQGAKVVVMDATKFQDFVQRGILKLKSADASISGATASAASSGADAAIDLPKGSDFLPAKFKLPNGTVVTQSDLVSTAFTASGLSVDDWNAQDDDSLMDSLELVYREAVQAAHKAAKPATPVAAQPVVGNINEGAGNSTTASTRDTSASEVAPGPAADAAAPAAGTGTADVSQSGADASPNAGGAAADAAKAASSKKGDAKK